MGKLTTAERLNEIRGELHINKKKFTSSSNGKKKKKFNKKKMNKITKKYLRETYTESYINYLKSLPEDEMQEELDNNEMIFMEPTIEERYESLKYQKDKQREREKAYRKYVEKQNPKTLAELEKCENKFDKNAKKIQKKYRKRGFDLYNDRVIKVDTDDLIKRIKNSKKINEKINDKFLSFMDEVYNGETDLPEIYTRVSEKNDEITKSTKKLIKSLEKMSLHGVKL